MTQYEYLMSEGEAAAVLTSLMARKETAAQFPNPQKSLDFMSYGQPAPPTFTSEDEAQALAAIEAAEAKAALAALDAQGGIGGVLSGVTPTSDPRQDIRAINQAGITARLFDDEDPYTILWHADGRSSRVPRVAVNRYLKKRDHITGQRVFFQVPPPGIVPPTFTIACLVRPCRKTFPNQIQQYAHAEVYHPQEMQYMVRQKQLNQEQFGEQERGEIRKERQMMQAMLMALVAKDPAMGDVIKSMGINLDS